MHKICSIGYDTAKHQPQITKRQKKKGDAVDLDLASISNFPHPKYLIHFYVAKFRSLMYDPPRLVKSSLILLVCLSLTLSLSVTSTDRVLLSFLYSSSLDPTNSAGLVPPWIKACFSLCFVPTLFVGYLSIIVLM
jgi:hypothetical protein